MTQTVFPLPIIDRSPAPERSEKGTLCTDLPPAYDPMLVSRAAVFDEEGGSFVFVQGPEGWIKKKVEIGLPNFTMVAIRSGIQQGDVIALQRPI